MKKITCGKKINFHKINSTKKKCKKTFFLIKIYVRKKYLGENNLPQKNEGKRNDCPQKIRWKILPQKIIHEKKLFTEKIACEKKLISFSKGK